MIQSYHNSIQESDNMMNKKIDKKRIEEPIREMKETIEDLAYHETKKHADTMFAFNIYPCTIPLDFSFVPLHWQDSVELIYIKKGNGYVCVDFETFSVKAGDIVIVLPGHIHGLQTGPGERMEYENIIFSTDFLSNNQMDVCSQNYLYPLFRGKTELPVYIDVENVLHHQVAAYLDRIDRLCDEHLWGYELGVKGMMLSLFSELFRMASEKQETAGEYRNRQKIKAVLLRIEEDYDKRLTIKDVAAECGYSESHFMRWFKENTGRGFNDYLIDYRLSRAARELRANNDAILDIAERTGFENLSNFNRLFKKRFDMTPSQFRKKE